MARSPSRPVRWTPEERALVFIYCSEHNVAHCPVCGLGFRFAKLGADPMTGRTNLCTRCRRDLTEDVRVMEDATQRRLFVLQIIQPGLAGLMDGSVSTLAPLFAAAFAITAGLR